MEKRLIVAIALSMLVLLAWQALIPKPPTPKAVEVGHQAKETATLPSPQVIEEKPIAPATLWQKDLDKHGLSVAVEQAAIRDIIFKDYQSGKMTLSSGFAFKGKGLFFTRLESNPLEAKFVHKDAEKKITKAFTFYKSSYAIDLQVSIQNLSSSVLKFDSPLILGVLDFKTDPGQQRFSDIVIAGKDKTSFVDGRKNFALQRPKFIGIRNQYFCAIIEPEQSNYSATITKIDQNNSEISLTPEEALIIDPGKTLEQKFRIYLGPLELKIIQGVNPEWASTVNYGFFSSISGVLLQLLEFFYRLVHNWGLAIIILSLAIFFLLFPLSLKQMRSMKEMQALQPAIEELRKTYKDNPQKLHKETLELYKAHKVNPFGGCLPLILQMPIFFALYQALIRSVPLKGASFLWISDLSQPDKLFILPVSLPLIGNEFNILPILMAVIMFVQQKISMGHISSEQAEQQKIMMIIMPFMFGFIFYHMPAGLVLYWFVNSLLMAAYQFRVNRAK